MNTHPKPIELIEYAAGHLPAPAMQQVKEHLQTCSLCQVEVQQLQEANSQMDQWIVETGSIDLTARILDEVQSDQPDQYQISVLAKLTWAPVAKIAAAIVIASGVGHTLALLTSDSTPTQAIHSEIVADSFYFSVLTESSPVGFASAILETNDDYETTSEVPG